MRKDIRVSIEWVRKLANGCALMAVAPADGKTFPEIEAGQFVNIKVPDTNGVFLRRPISVCDFHEGVLTLFIKPVGKGTDRLCSLQEGAEFDVLVPLGKPFSFAEERKNCLLVGGGVGIAPLLYLGRKLKEQGAQVTYLLGGASAADLEMAAEFEKYGPVYLTTADGSLGVKGFVTDHQVIDAEVDQIYACGPTPMMKAVAQVAKRRNVPMQASLENHMACGLGACLCCVEDTRKGNQCVCTEGPVFDIKQLKW